MPYPTREEILEHEIIFRMPVIEIVKEWKNEYFSGGKWNKTNKNKALQNLIEKLSIAYSVPVGIRIGKGLEPMYDRHNRTITLDADNPSIISTLHEFAHALNGDSELTACRWSIWLFKKEFPKSFEKLEWDKHLLRKKQNEHKTNAEHGDFI